MAGSLYFPHSVLRVMVMSAGNGCCKTTEVVMLVLMMKLITFRSCTKAGQYSIYQSLMTAATKQVRICPVVCWPSQFDIGLCTLVHSIPEVSAAQHKPSRRNHRHHKSPQNQNLTNAEYLILQYDVHEKCPVGIWNSCLQRKLKSQRSLLTTKPNTQHTSGIMWRCRY